MGLWKTRCATLLPIIRRSVVIMKLLFAPAVAPVITRNAVCAKDQPGGVCMIQAYDQLITLAHGTAVKPVRDPALAVILVK